MRIALSDCLLSLVAIAVLCASTLGNAAEPPPGPWARHTIDAANPAEHKKGADGVRLADVNGDGRMDITTGWEEGGAVRVYINPGHDKVKKPWPAVTAGIAKSVEDAVLADLDGDGAADVISSTEGGNRTVYVHWAPQDRKRYLDAAAWQTQPVPATAGKEQWMFALPMRVDDKHGVDVVVSSKGRGSVGWLEAPPNPRDLAAWKYHKLIDAGWIMSLRAYDMNGDGHDDIVVSDRKGKGRGVYWLEHPGPSHAATAAWKRHDIGGRDHEVLFLDVVAPEKAGERPQVVCATRKSEILWFTPSTDAAGTTAWQTFTLPNPPRTPNGKAVAVGDIDLDGHLDLVHTSNTGGNRRASGVAWFDLTFDDGRPQIEQVCDISGREGVKFDRIELIDLDGDGDLDVITCEERDNLGVFWYENPASSPPPRD